MDKQSRTISIKVNGTEAKYEEKKEKEEFDWMLVDGAPPHNVVPFQKTKLSSVKKYKKKWSSAIIVTVATAIVIGTFFGMGMLHLLTGQKSGEERVATVTSTEKNGGTEQKEPVGEEKKEEAKPNTGSAAALAPLTLYFVQGGLYSTQEKGQASLEEWKENGNAAAMKPTDDKYSLVVGIASDEASVDKLMAQYKKDGISVVKKKWEITDQALLKNDKEYGSLLVKLQSICAHFVKYMSDVQAGSKGNQKEMAAIENEWKAIKKEGDAIKREDIKKLYTYASVAVQTIKEEKNDKETIAKLNQVVIDSLLSYEKMVSQKVK
ncbi:stage II sporulation protein B [Bacillus sp. DX1.1]|uniref:stage II sporulation protein B n=1 Tax=unclassified Bacillus (in: firmicutes) TaxID=185979 RepID=UPI00256FB045|nr:MULTISPECIES: stage II sporulation protein B [unclassified Bacillus (in: firmicutes)]MDM5156648.1 stage II sporulation protein B [Bacillus sp. DX1.1]WJE80905.1 stage II sporulation protein B [Bacillus sp. DX3.1]